MKNNFFTIKKLPDLCDDFIKEKADSHINDVYMNYEYLIRDTLKILELSLMGGIKKPLIMHNLFFAVELFLKLYLIKFSSMSLIEIEKEGHNIINLIELANKLDYKTDFGELKYLLLEFKNKEKTKLEIEKYHNYKYNHEKGKTVLIFDFELNENEKIKIREVIKWISSYMLIL